MNPLAEVLQLDEIRLDVDVGDGLALLHVTADLLGRRLGLRPADVFASLAARETLGSTGLGHGVAIPHARMAHCKSIAGAFVRTRVAVPFDAPDHKAVSLFLALVVPKEEADRHLKILAAAAAMFGDRSFREKLRASASPEAVRALLADWSDAPTATARDQDPASVAAPRDSSAR